MPTVAVVICTYRRPDTLLPCLDGLAVQQHVPDDVILVVRPSDTATHAALRARLPDHLPWRIVPVEAPGLVAARNAGLAATRCDIVTFCDDDTVAAMDWLARIVNRFAADPGLGGLGGRDRCHDGTGFDDRRRRMVGRLQWFGRPVGNHHLGYGGPRAVDFLKGANMSFRLQAVRGLRFDDRLRGRGAQPHDDMAFSLAVRRDGWRMIYDPAVALAHYCGATEAPRGHVASAGLPDEGGYYDSCFNLILTLQDNLLGARRLVWRIWSWVIGIRVCPGLVQALRLTPAEGRVAWRKFALARSATASAAAMRRVPGQPPAASLQSGAG